MAEFAPGEVGTGPGYEAERPVTRARLASAAPHRRLDLGGDLVLVFETRETVRAALQERLRADRVTDPERVAGESAAFAHLLGGSHELAATLYLDLSDAVALADRVADLSPIARAVSLEVGSSSVPAQCDDDDGSGACHLRFRLGSEQRAAVLDGAPVTVTIAHPTVRATAALSAAQVTAIAADLRG